ncbi:hypothetical protein IMCC1989_1077 [gamma proteobacterium IMCC1989]|nr:hypothetical protein IMCC1989_1077 [gamma proteobacterium IMCC1989]
MLDELEVKKVMVCANSLFCLSYKKAALTLLAIVLTACGTSPQEVVIRDVNDANVRRDSVGSDNSVEAGVITSAKKQTVITREATAETIQPVYSASARSQSPLQKKLLVSAQDKLSSNDPQGAIVLAEKGLRIDRKDPQFYIVLADAYERLDDKKQSTYFAQQGLRYAQKDSPEYRNLQRWLP